MIYFQKACVMKIVVNEDIIGFSSMKVLQIKFGSSLLYISVFKISDDP